MIFETTKKHFKLFKREHRKWMRKFGLLDWDVHYYHDVDPDHDRAWASFKISDRICGVGLGLEWEDTEPTEHNIRAAAFHEVCEILLARLDTEAKYRYATEDNINEARHAVIHILEKVIWENIKR